MSFAEEPAFSQHRSDAHFLRTVRSPPPRRHPRAGGGQRRDIFRSCRRRRPRSRRPGHHGADGAGPLARRPEDGAHVAVRPDVGTAGAPETAASYDAGCASLLDDLRESVSLIARPGRERGRWPPQLLISAPTVSARPSETDPVVCPDCGQYARHPDRLLALALVLRRRLRADVGDRLGGRRSTTGRARAAPRCSVRAPAPRAAADRLAPHRRRRATSSVSRRRRCARRWCRG